MEGIGRVSAVSGGIGESKDYAQIRIDRRTLVPLLRIAQRHFVELHAVVFETTAGVEVTVDHGHGAEAISLYRGPLLQDFDLRPSDPFERWRMRWWFQRC